MSAQQAFLREQIAFCTQYYMQVRPGSRAAASACDDMGNFRNRLAAVIREERRAQRAPKAVDGAKS